MPDITMCEGTNCPLAEKCYRFQAMPSPYRQSYFTKPPYDPEKSKCGYYWPVTIDDGWPLQNRHAPTIQEFKPIQLKNLKNPE